MVQGFWWHHLKVRELQIVTLFFLSPKTTQKALKQTKNRGSKRSCVNRGVNQKSYGNNNLSSLLQIKTP